MSAKSVSDVWKDGQNVQDGVRLDLVAHLKNANQRPEAVKMKNRAVELCKLETTEHPTILDIGCGIGSDLLRMIDTLKTLNKSASLTGIDFNSEMVAGAQYEVSQAEIPENISVTLQKMDATQLEFPDASFDLVFISCTLQHISGENVKKVIDGVKRVLKPRGRAVIVEPEQSAMTFYTRDQRLKSLIDKVFSGLPMASSSVGSSLFWIIRESGLNVVHKEGLASLGSDLKGIDPGWVKLNGMARMAVAQSIVTQEEADEFVQGYMSAAETEDLLCSSLVFLYEAQN